MDILFVANRIPYPPYRGDKLKIYNLAKRLHKQHRLTLLTFAENKEELAYIEPLKEIFSHIEVVYLPKWRSALNTMLHFFSGRPLQVLYFQSKAFKQLVDKYLANHRPDAIHVQHLRMAQYLEHYSDRPRILDLPDAFSLYWERRKTIKRKWFNRLVDTIESARVIRYEKILQRFNLNLVCSVEDLEFLKEKHHTENIKVLPNGVDLDVFYPRNHDYSHNHTLLFTGNMDYAPNIDAVQYFTESIFPLIKDKFPGTRFVIAGQRPVKAVTDLAGPGIEVTGFVKDLSEMYNQASIVVAPLRFGAGTQNKVLEAMAMGIPVVCSNVGFKGLGIESGEGAIMHTDAVAFAETVIALLGDENYRRTTGEKGAAVMRNRFGWDAIARTLETYCAEVSTRP